MDMTIQLTPQQWEQVQTLAAKEGVAPETWLYARLTKTLDAAARRRWLAPPGLPTMEEFMKGVTPEMLHGPHEGLYDTEGERG